MPEETTVITIRITCPKDEVLEIQEEILEYIEEMYGPDPKAEVLPQEG